VPVRFQLAISLKTITDPLEFNWLSDIAPNLPDYYLTSRNCSGDRCSQPSASGKLLSDGLSTLRLSASYPDTGHHFASSSLQNCSSAEYLVFQDSEDESDLGEAETLVVCNINDSVLSNCPRVEVSVRDIVISSNLDTGAQV
jgi:hypothetical protein